MKVKAEGIYSTQNQDLLAIAKCLLATAQATYAI